MQFFAEYGLFLAKTLTLVIAILIVLIGIIVITSKSKGQKDKAQLIIKNINEKYDDMKDVEEEDFKESMQSDYINWGDALSDQHINWFRK